MSQKLEKPCKFGCNFMVVWKGKTGQPGSTGFFEKGSTIEHTFDRCREIKQKGIKQNVVNQYHQEQQQMKYPEQTKQVQSGDAPTGITTNSVYIVASDTRKEVRELKKQIQTLTEVVDSMAQQNALIIKQTGYPKPEPVQIDPIKQKYLEDKKVAEAVKQVEQSVEDDIKANPGFAEFLDNQKAIEEANNNIADSEIINPYRMPKMEDEVELEQKVTDGWEIISEKFICHGCESPKFNGFEKYGTKVCPDCKEGIDVQNP